MTFDEFLIKKKIDRKKFGLAEPALLADFAHDFVQMGEKSFDHTKKYWFNQLRRRYKLAEAVKIEKVVDVTEAALAKDGTVENLVAKSAQPVKKMMEPGSEKREEKSAFKPRFASTKIVAEPASDADAEKTMAKSASEEKPEKPAPKPVFRPRFVPPSKPKE